MAAHSKSLPLIFHCAADLPPLTQRWLVGVSGGCDSMTLLHALHQAGYRRLVVCHLNHQLRGRDSTADAAIVQKTANALGYPAEVGTENVRILAKESKLSVETAARQARHAFFFQCAARHRCPRLMLAHHAGDQVETVLQNIFRGTSLAGLAGMKAKSILTTASGRRTLTVLRPFLKTTRLELEDYAAQHRLPYRHDSSNDSLEHQRNRIRHRLLPMLQETFGRSPAPGLLRLAEIAQSEDELLSQMAEEFLLADKLLVRDLRRQPLALQRRILRRWLQVHHTSGVDFDLIESVRALLAEDCSTARANLPEGRFVRRTGGVLYVC